jgi:replicative DNA helicase
MPLESLSQGNLIATASTLPCESQQNKPNGDLCRLMGYLAGDGSYLGWGSSVSFISNDRETFSDVEQIIDSHWPGLNRNVLVHPEGYTERNFGSGRKRNPLKAWLEDIGCLGKRDSTKRVPQFVFEAGEVGAREFLAGYLATDGCVKFSKQHPRAEVQFDSTSRALLEDVQILLLKLGIVSTINGGGWNTKSTKPIYRLVPSIVDQNIRKFATIPVRGRKRAKLDAILGRPLKAETGPGLFALPVEVSEWMWERSGGRASGGGWTHQGKRPRRSSAARWAEKYSDTEISTWANSDLLWEGIRSIEPAGEREVFDLSVPGCHNFVANGIVVHNSGDIENDADVLMWIEGGALSRDMDTAVEIHVGKQREGPAGFSIPMVFHPLTQTFEEARVESE